MLSLNTYQKLFNRIPQKEKLAEEEALIQLLETIYQFESPFAISKELKFKKSSTT
jgi:hypothetical protein